MLFNSIDFAVFLPLVFLLYWFVFQRNLKIQNLFLLVVSYIFYGWWDWRFLGLIAFSTFVDYVVGIQLGKTEKHRYKWLLISILVNLGFLGFFKYFNFFLDNFITAFSWFGVSFQASSLEIILPVGISFYTFQTMSYSIDVYRRKLEPTSDFIAFSSFVTFFPQLVAGPIERATHLLPQFQRKRNFNFTLAVDGMRQILWGLFKKMVIADGCAYYVNLIYADYDTFSASTLLAGAVLFSFQIYGDFSGYSDIALGTSRLFGFDLMRNFSFPYFSRDMSEFWRKWHISLSTWFRDYLYIPLGGSMHGKWKALRNTFIIFGVSGFWHGANWTFITWGLLNALFFLPLLLTDKNRKYLNTAAEGRLFPSFKEFISILFTFFLCTLAWVFFRASSMHEALHYLHGMVDVSLFKSPDLVTIDVWVLLLFFIGIEWLGREKEHALQSLLLTKNRFLRWSFYGFILFLIGMFMQTEETPFIYFQF